MKRFLLALVVSSVAVIALPPPPEALACSWFKVRDYYPCSQPWACSPCGVEYFYCEGFTKHNGCRTAYYQDYYLCGCP